jgi:hypothetical protein
LHINAGKMEMQPFCCACGGGTRWLAEQAAQKRRQAAALQAKRDFSLRSK